MRAGELPATSRARKDIPPRSHQRPSANQEAGSQGYWDAAGLGGRLSGRPEARSASP